jgi:hypothetical protein
MNYIGLGERAVAGNQREVRLWPRLRFSIHGMGGNVLYPGLALLPVDL